MRDSKSIRGTSAAFTVAIIALVAALGGSASALPGKNTVDKNDLQKGVVKTKNIKAGAVTGAKVAPGTLTGAHLAPNTLTGAQIDESTLGTVPTAAKADKADKAGDLSGRKIFFRMPSGTGDTPVLNAGGLVITASCIGGVLAATATTTVDNAFYGNQMHEPPTGTAQNGITNSDFDANEPQNLLGSDTTFPMGNLVYSTPAGSVVTVTYHANQIGGSCVLAGTALVG